MMQRYILFLIQLFLIFPAFSANGEDRIPPFSPRLVKIGAEAELDSLEDMGVHVLRRRGDILLCLFPNAATRSGESRLRRQRPIAPTLDIAKKYYDAASIQNGAATGTGYTGKGVVVGLCDIGIDPLHPTFLDADGRSRIKRVVQYVEQEGIRLELEGDDAYSKWVTDNPDMNHATHVCGILAGGGAGTPYSGIASDAEIVATVSTLTEVGLLAGVEDIIDYAREVGKPAVINISVGGYTGAHDGSSLFSQYLDMCAEEAIIVISAGNEGANKNSLTADFSQELGSVSFKLSNRSWDQFEMYGATEIWSATSKPLRVTLGLYDSDGKTVVRWLEPFTLTEGNRRNFSWTTEENGGDAFPFDGDLAATGYVDPENGRHVTILEYEYTSPEVCVSGGWARYVLAVKIDGNPGDEVEVYADGSYTRLAGLSGNPQPSSDMSVSDLACGFNVVSVGMYGNRDSVPRSRPEMLGDDEVYWEQTRYEEGATVPYSSYGRLRDGRVLPLTVAPGADLMSAGSGPFFQAYPFHPHLRLEGAAWMDEGGTSMSAPYVAGYVATWLEAVPTLTSADVLRIISETNRMDIPDPDDPHNGCGYFDPVKGLKLALQSGGVEAPGVSTDDLDPGTYVEAYDLTGVKRYAGAASGLSGIGKGMYVVKTGGKVTKRMID